VKIYGLSSYWDTVSVKVYTCIIIYCCLSSSLCGPLKSKRQNIYISADVTQTSRKAAIQSISDVLPEHNRENRIRNPGEKSMMTENSPTSSPVENLFPCFSVSFFSSSLSTFNPKLTIHPFSYSNTSSGHVWSVSPAYRYFMRSNFVSLIVWLQNHWIKKMCLHDISVAFLWTK